MKLKPIYLSFRGNKPIVTLTEEEAREFGVNIGDRIKIKYNDIEKNGIVSIVTKHVEDGMIGISDPLWSEFNFKENSEVTITLSGIPKSLVHIRAKLKGRKLSKSDIFEIVEDVGKGNLSDIEITSFVTTLHNQGGPTIEETYNLVMAMVENGKTLTFSDDNIVDKHSIGGIPGDKTSLLVVPIIAAAGITIPKTSSRAITSAAGTADRAETFMPVTINSEKMKEIVNKTNGCIVWGGSIDLAPADDIFIKVEYPISIDPMLLPSIMSKKKSVGSKHLLIDIPTGVGAKMKTIESSDALAKEFIELGKKIGIKTECIITKGDQPLGYAVGSGLEAKEALEVLMGRNVPDVIDKVLNVAGTLLEMAGKENGKELALDILRTGKAEKKFREIIECQGGNPNIKPEDIEIGEFKSEILSKEKGYVTSIECYKIITMAKFAGSPKNKKSGIIMNKKIGDSVEKGDILYTIYSDNIGKLELANKMADENYGIRISENKEMIIHKVKMSDENENDFVLER